MPEKNNLSEITELNLSDRQQLMEEINLTSEILQNLYKPYKINIATLGNIVRQLHIHIIARFQDDEAWPNSVWSHGISQPYIKVEAENIVNNLVIALKELN